MSGTGISYPTPHSTLRASVALTSLLCLLLALSLSYSDSIGNHQKPTHATPALALLITGWAPAFFSSFLEILRKETSRVSLYFMQERHTIHDLGTDIILFPWKGAICFIFISSHFHAEQSTDNLPSLLVSFFMVIVFQKCRSCQLSFHQLRS